MGERERDGEVPLVWIDADWSTDEIETIEDCDDALAALTSQIVGIESRILSKKESGAPENMILRATHALRWKKTAMQIVQSKRGQIGREQAAANARLTHNEMRDKLGWIKANHPEIYQAAVAATQGA